MSSHKNRNFLTNSISVSRTLISFFVILGQIAMPLSWSTSAYSQIVADPNAGGYRPDVTTPPNTNNVPVVNITAPNAAGVSRNQYNQFDVQQQGAILNNNATNSNTQLAGWIQGNANFQSGQSARIILNEVTSGNPTMLGGYIEVAGNRAEVIVANPAGIAVSGGGFINASSATLTTGTPVFTATGHLEAFRVGGGNARIQINGGLDTSTVDYTRIIARAVEINSGIWAKDLTLASGTGDFAPDGTPISLTVEDDAGKPLFAIDVAALGGMYAGKIRLIGTEAGVGVRNAGHIGASVGQVAVTADGRLVNTGAINAQSQINLQAREISNSNIIYSQGTLTASADNMVNAGIIAAQNDLTLQAQTIENTEDALIAAGLDSEGGFTQSGNLTLQTSNTLTNAGTIAATQNLAITGNTTIDNKASGQIIAGRTLSTDINTLTNRGLLDGSTTHLKANSITNLGTGSIYGDHVAIESRTLTNKDEAGTGAVIAARDRMGLGIGTLYNQHDALIYAINDLHIGGGLDASLNATGSAVLIQNDGATIESGGSMVITTQQLNNTNPTFAMERESEYVGHVTKIHVGYNTYDISEIFVIRNVNTRNGLSGSLTSAGNSLASLQGILGELDGRYIILPSTNGKFPSDKFGPGVLSDIPALAYIPYHEVTHGDPSEGGSVEIIQETFNYGPDSHLWDLFGVTVPTARPEKPACMSSEWGCMGQAQQEQQRIYNEWAQANMPLYQALNGRIQEFWTDIQSRMVEDQFYVDDYDVRHYRDVVTASRPGEIIAGGNLTINITNPAGNLTNDKSRVMAGGDLVINGSVNNIDAKGEAFDTHTGTSAFTYMQSHSMGSDDRRWRATTLNITGVAREETLYVDATPESNASISGSNPDLSASDPNLPNNSFYTVNPGADKNYLIETDPRFTQYGKWLSSDYMLSQLGIDASIHKRLGDGFYEQQLIREQIGQLTGYRFLAGYNSDEEQYKALMNAGAEYAQEHQLSVGIALTAEQMLLLTSDIIWLISKDVTLPDGTIETVLVPQVYTRSGTNMIIAGGTLLSGNNVLIEGLDGQNITLTNTATIAAKEGLFVDATYIQNKVGQLHGNNVLLASAGDIDNLGGIISADNSITMIAERDINISSTVGHGYDDKGHISGIAKPG